MIDPVEAWLVTVGIMALIGLTLAIQHTRCTSTYARASWAPWGP